MPKVLVLYVFHIFNDRVKHFIEKCMFQDNSIHFILISNGNNNFYCPPYAKKLVRKNIGYDFGGWSEGVIKNHLYNKYDRYIFVNSSIKGPFMPPGYNRWTDLYINGLKDNIKLFGSTINTIDDPINKSHVQSYIFAMDKITLRYLIDSKLFSLTNHAKTFREAITKKEILMSRLIIKKGWNIGSLFKYYDGVDFTFSTKKPKDYNFKFLNDIMYDRYKNSIWKLDELVFVKGNRVNC